MAAPATPISVLPAPNPAAAQLLITTAHVAFTFKDQTYDDAHNCAAMVHYMLVKLVNPKMPYLPANALVAWLASPQNGWKQITLDKVPAYAAAGKVVIGGLRAPGHGHVIVVLPGPLKPAGGYNNSAGVLMPLTQQLYPPCLSGSIGS